MSSNATVSLNHLPPSPEGRGLGIGIVGAGFIVRDCHLPAYAEAGFRVVGLTSRSLERARATAAQAGVVRTYSSVEEMLDDPAVQVVDIAVPPTEQPKIIERVIAHPRRVRGILAQKPLAMSFNEASQVVAACSRAGVLLQVNQNMRYDHSVRALKSLLDAGVLGEPVLATIEMRAIPHWMPWAHEGRSLATFVMSIHHLDTFRYWLGDPVRVLSSTRSDPRTKFEHHDGINLYVLEYRGGARAAGWDDVWAGPAREGAAADIAVRWRFEGTEGLAVGAIGWPGWPNRIPSTIDYSTIRDAGAWHRPRWEEAWFPDAFAGTMGSLLHAIETGSEPDIPGSDNLKTIALCEAVLTGARENRVVCFDLAEGEIDQTEMFYHSLVETIPQMILCKDLEGRFTFANQKFCAELGRSLEEIKGKTDLDFFPKDLAEKYRQDDKEVLRRGQLIDTVEEHVTPKGEKLYVQVMKTPLFNPDGTAVGIQGIFWDVTERMRAEELLKQQYITLQRLAESERQAHEALKSAQSRMVQTEKLASLGQLVAGVAHEINNPLAFVSNNVAVLERDLKDLVALVGLFRQLKRPQDVQEQATLGRIDQVSEQLDLEYTLSNLPELLDRTREGLRRIERIVKDLRLFARVDEGEWNEIDLNPGIDSAVNMVKGYARKRGVRLETARETLPPVRCRAARVHQVIVNLLMNAIDACPPEGIVTIRSRSEPGAGGVRIEVQDTGCGIEPEIRERIFDPFFTTKPVGEGTGLGLSISYGIVHEHRGSIEVESTPGEGSCFIVKLPREPDPERNRRYTQAAANPAARAMENSP
jgi:PAS domain S-box-containing protein